MASYDEMREKGFKDVDLYGISDVHRFCMENRMIPNRVYENIEDIKYGSDRTPLVLGDKRVLGKEWEYWLYKIGARREIILVGENIPEWILRFSENEKAFERERAKRGRAAKGKKGGYLGGFVPYGYYNVNKKLYVDDYESFIVKFVFYRHSQGCSLNGIARELNLRGFRNRNKKEFLAGSIDKILKNKRLYQGYVTYEGKEVKAQFSGILEEDGSVNKEWKERVFDAATEAKIARQREKHHGDMSVPHEVRPYILVGQDPKEKTRRVNGTV